jgi:uncharacterized protein (TIGR03437 family)
MRRHAVAVRTAYFAGVVALFIPAACRAQPLIASVQNAFSTNSTIAPNTWVAIRGSGLAPSGDIRTWQASDFTSDQLPTTLDGVNVTLNGENAYLEYISPTQLNILTPPDLATGSLQVKVTANGQTSAAFAVPVQALSLSFFVFDGTHVVATHLNYTDVGPTTLYQGLTTPAQPNEEVVLYANGFGATSSTVAKGSESQSGSLPTLPVVQIGGIPATVIFAGLVSPGLYQFNVVVPQSAANGDNTLTAQYSGQSTQSGVVITVQSNNPPKVQSLTLSESSVAGGGTVQGTVTISAPAPNGGIVVSLASNSSAATVPSSLTVPAGATSATFSITAGSVSSTTSATITASYQGSSAQAALSVTASGGGGNAPFGLLLATSLSCPNGGSGNLSIGLAEELPDGSIGREGSLACQMSYPGTAYFEFGVGFNTVQINGNTFTFSGINAGPDSGMIELSASGVGNSYPITVGSVTVTLSSQSLIDGVLSGTLTGTFTVTSSFATVSGTVSGTFTAQ